MTPVNLTAVLTLAQTDTMSDFLYQVRGLVAFVCALGVFWVALLVLTIQRNAERRRREKLGLEPLPNMWVSLYRWITQQGDSASQTPAPAAQRESQASAALPAPDLGMLTGNLPEPDLSAFDDGLPAKPEPVEVAPEPARSAPAAMPAVPAAEQDIDAAELEQSFMLDDNDRQTQRPASSARDEAPQDAVEVLRVFRDLSDGTLIVEIGGERFNTVEQMQLAKMDRRFVKVVRELAILVRDAQQVVQQSPAQRTRRTPRVQSMEPPFPEGVTPAPQAQPPAATPPAPEPPASEPSEPPPNSAPPASETTPKATNTLPDDDLPSMAPGAMFRQMGRAAFGQKPDTPPPDETPAPKSIAEQIEELLQARLVRMPEYRGRDIHVMPAISGGVRIQVDDEYYEGIGDVADDDVRALLQDVVREWEKRT